MRAIVTVLALGACASNATVPVGSACSADDVCLTGFCILEADANGKATQWAGGYCSGNCEHSACPHGSCLSMAGKSYCVASCAADRDCRAGYVCDQHASACLPDCRRGWSCGSTLTCNSNNGNCELPKGSAKVGDACSSDNDCADGFCIPEADTSREATGWTGGYCSGDCASACPQGDCLAMADGSSYCVAGCATDDDCRSGYVCPEAVSACLPDCRKGWSCGTSLRCSSADGSCVAPGP